MSRVLFLAYHFPPIGGGGVQRNAKFARYLPEFGHTPIVVTGPGRSADRWAPDDEALLRDVDGVETHRVPGPEPRPSPLRDVLASRLLLTPRFLRWWVDGAVALGTEVGRSGIDVVYGSLVPYATAEAAQKVARRLGKPWIADLQDPWALDETWLYPSALHRALDRRRMRRLLGAAAAVIMNTPEAALRVRAAFAEFERRRVVSIPNGFDAADFAGPRPERRDDVFRVVHTGYLHTDQGLRLRRTRRIRRLVGGMAPVDILPRSHVYLLRALERLLADDPALGSAVEVVLAGVTTQRDREVAEASPVTVRFPGYLPHPETVALLRSADLLFLPMHDLPEPLRAGLVPGKAYEYLAAGPPILAAVPGGDARDLLEAAGNARICRPADVDGIAAHLAAEIERWRSGASAPPSSWDVLKRYERRELTRQLADIVSDVAGEQRRPDAA